MGDDGGVTATRWRARLLAAALVVAVGILGVVRATAPEPIKTQMVAVPGPEGVPRMDYGGSTGVQDNPVTVAQWALRSGGESLIPAADWFVTHQDDVGAWRYGFEWRIGGPQLTLEPGWTSALAQGLALSVLAEAHDAAGDTRYEQAARAGFQFMMRPVEDGGVRTDMDGGLWFEEYPTDPPSYVLNGFVTALIGLDDARELVPEAGAAFAEGVQTLEDNIGRWDRDGHVLYDLFHEIDPEWGAYYPGYDPVHDDELARLLERHPNAIVAEWHAYWYRDGAPPATAEWPSSR